MAEINNLPDDVVDVARSLQGKLSEKVEAKLLESIGREIKGGDKGAVLQGVYLCLKFNIALPPWLVRVFCKRMERAEDCWSWDDVFGPLVPKGTKQAGREITKHRHDIWRKVRELRVKGVRGDEVFEKAAAELSLSFPRGWRTIRDIYYSGSKWQRDHFEWVTQMLDAAYQELGPEPAPEKLLVWMNSWTAEHPFQSSEKPTLIKRKTPRSTSAKSRKSERRGKR
jgi:hypothetical protein